MTSDVMMSRRMAARLLHSKGTAYIGADGRRHEVEADNSRPLSVWSKEAKKVEHTDRFGCSAYYAIQKGGKTK